MRMLQSHKDEYTYFPTGTNASTWAVDIGETDRIYIDTYWGTLFCTGKALLNLEKVDISYTYYDFRTDVIESTDVDF